MCDFNVKVNKIGSKAGLLFEAMSTDTTININQVHFNENINVYYDNYVLGKIDNDSYTGPDFTTLDEVIFIS